MEFLKNHYEKIALGIVLLALAGVAVWLPLKIKEDKGQVQAILQRADAPPRAQPIEPVDLSTEQAIRQETQDPPEANFSGLHNLLNPVRWIRTPQNVLEKLADEGGVGPKRVQIDAIKPLMFKVEYSGPSGNGYNFRVTRESAQQANARRPRVSYVSMQAQKNDAGGITLKKVNGPAADPLTFDLEINDTLETIVVSKSMPFSATNGYSADLSYPLERRTWRDVRVGQPLVFANDTNIVVDISRSEVILRAVSNEKPTTISFNDRP